MIKSDQDGIESIFELLGKDGKPNAIKSDQDGIERISTPDMVREFRL